MFSLRLAPLLLAAAALAATASASPIAVVSKRAYGSIPSSASCGGHSFSGDDISAAIDTGVNDENSGSSPSGYPHAYYQYADEHITLSCNDADQYLEFPLENGYGFTGGSPGAYRAIFTEDGEFCAVVYHESRSDNSFAQCDY